MSGGVVAAVRQPSLGALRQRRDAANKPGLSRISTRASTVDATDIPDRVSHPVPLVRTAEYTLRKFAGSPPSLLVHLHINHFRFDQQDGNFAYNSPVGKCFMKHLKEKTVPHDLMEEFFASGVAFYDGALIVEVHNHRNNAGSGASATTNQVGGTSDDPFSIHNWHEHIVPSGHVKLSELMLKMTKTDKPNSAQRNAEENKMPAPEVPASASRPKGPVIFTTVLFPSALSLEAEKQILATTPFDNFAINKRLNESGLPHPPTPLASVPSTPIVANSVALKNSSKMFLDEETVKEFEAAVLLASEPVLYLEPAKDFDHQLAIMDKLRHPQHDMNHGRPKTRKRTIAEVAAEEEDAAKEVRFILNGDERQIASLGAGAGTGNGSNEGQSGSGFGGFKRFKTLEAIKLKHDKLKQEASEKEDQERREKAARDALELEQKKKEKLLEHQKLVAQANLKQQQEKNAQQLKIQQQQHAQMQMNQQAQSQAMALEYAQQQSAIQNAQAAQLANNAKSMAMNGQQTPIPAAAKPSQMSQASAMHMSPVARQMTPMNGSPLGDGQHMSAMTSVPMSATASNPGAGSPLVISGSGQGANGVGMTRNVSQQPGGPPGSNMSTPQMNNTPRMGSAGPAQRMTPQASRMQGSPLPGQLQSAPMMMTASQGANLSAEARINLMRQQQIQQQQQRQHMMTNGQLTNGQAMQNLQTMQHMQNMQQMQNRQNLQNMANNMSGLEHLPMPQRVQVMQQMQAQRQSQQMQQGGMAMAPQNGVPQQTQQTLPQQAHSLVRQMQTKAHNLANPQLMQLATTMLKRLSELEQNTRAASNSRRQVFMAQFAGQVPPNQMQSFHKNEQSMVSEDYAKFITIASQTWSASLQRMKQIHAQQAMVSQAQQQGQMQQHAQQQLGMHQMASMHQMGQNMMPNNAAAYQQQLQARAQQAQFRQNMINAQHMQQQQQQQQNGMMQHQQNGMQGMQGLGGVPMQQQMSMMGMQGHMGQPGQPGMPGQHGMGS